MGIKEIMAKKFSNYQYVCGEMNERDKQEVESKFWNEGKFNNFVRPFLPNDCKEMTFVDIGCNHGIFLKLAENMGFKKVIGVDSHRKVIQKARQWRKMNGGKYEVRRESGEFCIYNLPMTDYLVLANAHYYFGINHWLDFVREMKNKARYCIIVTAQKNRKPACKASPDILNIREYFKDWEEINFLEPSLEGDPYPRRLYGICFKNPLLERVGLDKITCGNNVQNGYYEEIDKNINPLKTKYYKILKPYRKNWSEKRLKKHMLDKANLYKDVKKHGVKKPIIVKREYKNGQNRIIDGNHRYNMLKHLGHKSAIVRFVI